MAKAKYEWAEDIEALCITAIRKGERDAVLRAMDAKPASERAMTFEEALDAWNEDALPFQLWSSGEFLIVVEPNGYHASLPETLQKMAPAQDAISIFWNVNANMSVTVLEAGKVVRTFDPLMYDDDQARLPEEEGLPFGSDDDVQGAALAFLERRFGLSLRAADVIKKAQPTFDGKPA